LADSVCASQDAAELPAPCMRQFWSHHTVEHPEVQAAMAEMGLT
jgi:hypothetical protein